MAFQYPLQAVLHFRESVEHQLELRLRAANQRVARVRHMIEHLDGQRQQLHSAQVRELRAGMRAAELRFELQCDAELMQRRGELEQQLGKLQQIRQQQHDLLQQARRARETLEAVRDQQFREYKKQAARREQRSVDDLFLLRRQYLRRG